MGDKAFQDVGAAALELLSLWSETEEVAAAAVDGLRSQQHQLRCVREVMESGSPAPPPPVPDLFPLLLSKIRRRADDLARRIEAAVDRAELAERELSRRCRRLRKAADLRTADRRRLRAAEDACGAAREAAAAARLAALRAATDGLDDDDDVEEAKKRFALDGQAERRVRTRLGEIGFGQGD